MSLFEPTRSPETEEILGSDAATRALSVTVVENDFVAGVYEKLASVYDLTFGPALHPGRVDAIQRMRIKPGERGALGFAQIVDLLEECGHLHSTRIP